MYPIYPAWVLDATTLLPNAALVGQQVQVVTRNTTTPYPIFDAASDPIPSSLVTVTQAATTPTVYVDTVTPETVYLDWYDVASGARGPIWFEEVSRQSAVASAASSAASAAAAEASRAAAEAAVGNGGGGVAGVSSINSRTGAVSLVAADVGLGSVDNTSDVDKPVSAAQQAALDGKAGTGHTHTLAQVTGLVTALAGKMGVNGPVAIGAISATGTPSSSKFLRGDGTWAEPASANEVEYTGTEWPPRPATSRSVTFLSTKHEGAPLPNDMVIGDRIIRHP
jgi:hypothetical protein